MTLPAAPSTAADELRMVGTLMRLVRVLDQRVRAAERPDVMSITDLSVLYQIERGVDQPSTVARALRLDPARMTHVADRLVARGYLERAPDRKDRRRWRLRVTDTGRARLKQGQEDIVRIVDGVLAGLDAGERDALMRSLQAVRHVLDATPNATDA